ncbi:MULTISPECIES: hypothetical protein [unclassified Paraflavitalea]|uniref:hypothetical protein n=1 Tax=unclassified Paraflavitalea TaxID=2798305 RepID=UPI003D32DF49
MPNILEIATLCPLKFRNQNYSNPAPYNTKYFEDYHYRDTLPYYVASDDYCQIWQKNDIINVQIRANYGPHNLELQNYKGTKITEFVLNPVTTSMDGLGMNTYEASIALNTFDAGIYRFVLKSGSPLVTVLETDYFNLKDLHEGSILFEVTHNENDFGFVFETGIKVSFRVHGGFTEYTPQTDRVVFIDQPRNIQQLSARSYYTEKLVIGNSYGVPKWVIEKINEFFLCKTVLIDGKQWAAVSGAKFDASRVGKFQRAGWTMEVMPAKKRIGNRFVNDAPAAQTDYYVTYNIEGNLFGDFNGLSNSNIIQIQSNE